MRQLIVILIVLTLLEVSHIVGVAPGSSAAFDTHTLASTGFILLAAYAFGELFRRVRLPALLGYLAAGVIFGPSLAALVLPGLQTPPLSRAVLQELSVVNMLAVGVIGTMGGGELKVSDLKHSFPKLLAITVVTFTLVLPAIAAIILALAHWAPSIVPFLRNEPRAAQIAAALLFAVLAVGMSPSATLALLQEVRARGRLTSLVLGTVVFADLVLVALFLVTLALAKLLVSPEGFSMPAMAQALPHIAAEFGWAILIGVVVGLIFIAYLRLVGREILLFSLGVIFITSFVASRLHAETLLAFLIAGFVVQNFSSHGHALIEAFELIALPVFVIYFTTQAANLNLAAVPVYLPLTIILIVTRCTAFYFGIGIGSRLAKVDEETRRHLRVSFFSQGGVDLVLAAMIAESIPGWGVELQTVTMATILFYIVGGPPLLARALDTVGESAAARERGEAHLAERQRSRDAPTERVSLIPPKSTDNALGRRFDELYAATQQLLHDFVDEVVIARSRRRAHFLTELAQTITETVRSTTADRTTREKSLDAAILDASEHWNRRDFVAFDPLEWSLILSRLTDIEPFSSVHRVVREPHLFERDGNTWKRALRALRRIRRLTIGPGTRAVPTGRLWRYHVAFEVPIAWWERTKPHEADVWHHLLVHYQATREALTGARGPLDQSTVLAEAEDRERAILERMNGADERLERELMLALARAWREFLASAEIAGTFELPAWRYRMSSKYDTAQAAKAQLAERLHRDDEDTAGRKDALAAIARGHDLARWARDIVSQVSDRLAAEMVPLADELEATIDRCVKLVDPEARPPSGETHSPEFTQRSHALADALQQVSGHTDALTRHIGPQATVSYRSGFRSLSAELPTSLSPSADSGRAPAGATASRRVVVPLRSWASHTIYRDLAVALLSTEQEVETRVHQVAMNLHHAKDVLEYHLTSAVTTGAAVDAGLGERLAGMVKDGRDALLELQPRVRKNLDERAEQAILRGAAPLVSGQWDEIHRGARKLEDRDRPQDRVRRWFRDRRVAAVTRTRLRGRRLAEEIAAVFDDRSTPAEAEAFRAMITGPRSSMPEVYQRLFTSVPAETIGLIIERREVAMLREAVDHWHARRDGAILLRGDRGIGKRTLVRQLLNERAETLLPQWIRLSPTLEREVDVSGALARAGGWPSAPQLTELAAAARRQIGIATARRPTTIIVENTERLFRRTEAGLARVRAFLELIAATSSDILWIVLMAEPAAHALEAPFDFASRFARMIRVGPIGAPELQQIIQARHRLSGYGVRFAPHAPNLQDWLRHPAQAWHMLQRGTEGTYERLWQLSGGNVRQALHLWLAAIRPAPDQASMAVVGPLTAVRSPLIESLPLSSRFLLRTLLLLGPLEFHELALGDPQGSLDLETELARLAHLGLVRSEPLRLGSGFLSRLVSLELRAIAPLTEELRQWNLL